MKLFRYLLLSVLFLSFSIASCGGTIKYRVGSEIYESADEALAAKRKDNDLILEKITATQNALNGTAIVILPTVRYCEENLIFRVGSGISEGNRKKINNYMANLLLLDFQGLAGAIQKRRIFNSVQIINRDNPEGVDFKEDFAILIMKKDGRGQWFLKSQKSISRDPIGIEEIQSALLPFQG